MAAIHLTKKEIIESHTLLSDVLDTHSINRLIFLFDKHDIAEYVRNERRSRQLNENGVTVESMLYGSDKKNTTMLLSIKKQNKRFLHVTLHIAPEWLKHGKYDHGAVHLVKDIYETECGKKKQLLYALYYLEHPPHKPHSLTFTIADGYSTPLQQNATASFVSAVTRYENEVKEEMDVITSVLNRLFDEDDIEYYIRNYHTKYPFKNNSKQVQQPFEIHHNINAVLRNVNTRTKHIRRKNSGSPMFSVHPNTTAMVMHRTKSSTHKRNKSKNKMSSH